MDQTITVDSRWTFLRDRNDSPQAILVVNTDITDKKALQAKFLRAQRLESVGRLAGGIAHDLNNILSPLPMAVAMLREEVRSESGQAMLDTVESSAQRGANIVKQILTFARGIDGKRVVLQPKYLIKEMAKWIKETFPKSIVLKTEIPDKLWELNGDVTQLLQVLMNLCVNARDAMPNGGALTLGAENLWIDEVHSQLLPGIKAGNYVLLTVTDTGTGIPQEIIDRIFDPFFTTKKPDQGTGLGLSTALGLVRGHGGVVQVRSKIGQGTQFRIYLPAETAKTPAPPETVPQSLPKGNGEWILLVDDEAIIQEVTKKNLERYGYRVLTANDGKEAVTLYAKNQADIKVVLTDLNMPFMDGVAAIKAMKQTNPQAKFIVATGVGSSTYNENTPELKGHHFLIKPFSTEQLLCAVHKALQ
jgi:signal transduction histidine kinase/CheY-like chemotaxis protein